MSPATGAHDGAAARPRHRDAAVLTEPKLTAGPSREERPVARPDRRYGPGRGLTLGGILVIVGVVVVVVWSFWLGLLIAVVGFVAFGGFVRGKWY